MRYSIFGRTGLKTSQFALGTGRLGSRGDGTIDVEEAHLVIQRYLEAGGNLIDTAEAYQEGRSEEMIGEYLGSQHNGSQRDDMVVVSKYCRSTGGKPALGRLGNNRKAMVQSLEGSLRRLRTDRIDIYFAHFDDGVTPVEEIMRGFDDLVSAGKILYAGLSNFPAWRTSRAATMAELRGWAPPAAIEVEYSLLQRDTEREILPMARALDIGVLGYSPLGAGALARRQPEKDGSKRPTSQAEAIVQQVLKELTAIATELATTPARVALAWVREKGVSPILGARNASQLVDNLATVDMRLTADQIQQLDGASSIRLGYPNELLASKNVKSLATGNRWEEIDFPSKPAC